MKTKLAAVYERRGVLFILASHRTQAGFWVDDGQVITLDRPTDEELGLAIEAALSRSKLDIPTPPPTARFDKPLLEAANVGSWNTFSKGAKHVSVSIDDDLMQITPYQNLGGKNGFAPLDGQALEQSSTPAIGRTVLEVLAQIS